jgi:hypothetical protein
MFPFVQDPATAVTVAAMMRDEQVAAAHTRYRERARQRRRVKRRTRLHQSP